MKSITNILKRIPGHLLVGAGCILISLVLIMLNRSGIDLPSHVTIIGLRINFYGVFIALGVITATYFIERHLKQIPAYQQLSVWDQLPVVLLISIIGARLFHVLSEWHLYQTNLQAIITVWDGGLSYFGGILFGGVYIFLVLRVKKLPVLPLISSLVIYISLGQMIGRYGNFLNQELFGGPSGLPWAIRVGNGQFVHPAFLYEQVLNLILLLVIWYFYKKQNALNLSRRVFHDLLLIGVYLIGYGVVRLISEQFRLDPDWLGSFSFGEVMAIILLLLGIGFLSLSHYWRRHD